MRQIQDRSFPASQHQEKSDQRYYFQDKFQADHLTGESGPFSPEDGL